VQKQGWEPVTSLPALSITVLSSFDITYFIIIKKRDTGKSTSFSATPMKKQREAISTKNKLGIMNQHEEHKQIPYICRVLGLARSHVSNIRDSGRDKAIPLQANCRPWGFQEVETPRFRGKLHMLGGKVVSPKHQPQLPLDNIPDAHFC